MDEGLRADLDGGRRRLIDNLRRSAAVLTESERLALEHADRLRAQGDVIGADRELAAADRAGRGAARCALEATRYELRLAPPDAGPLGA